MEAPSVLLLEALQDLPLGTCRNGLEIKFYVLHHYQQQSLILLTKINLEGPAQTE